MQSETQQPLNDRKIAHFKDSNLEVSVYLANGIKLSGHIVEFDRETLILTSDAGPEGVSITRTNIATMTRRSEDLREPRHSRQEGGSKNTGAARRPLR
jgi:RNA chaperone Hfq